VYPKGTPLKRGKAQMRNGYLKRHFDTHKISLLSDSASEDFKIHIPHKVITAMLSEYVEGVKIIDSVKAQSVSITYIENGKVWNKEYYTPLDVLEDVMRLRNDALSEDMYENGISTYNYIEVSGTLDESGGCFTIQEEAICSDTLSILYYVNCGIDKEYIDATKPWATYVNDMLPTFSYAMYLAGDRKWDVGELVTGLEGRATHPDESDEEYANLSTGEFDELFGPSGSKWKR